MHYSYPYYRQNFHHEIAEDCLECCVYCDSHERDSGGRESMQIDHFRPYTRPGFEDLENDPLNFHHACARCNLLKSDWWESSIDTKSHDGLKGFIDPFLDNRADYFQVTDDGTLVAKKHPATYLIELLALDRAHLKMLRQKRILKAKLKNLVKERIPELEAAAKGIGDLSPEDARRFANDALQAFQLLKALSEYL
jgi:hypothetical protein